MSISTVAQDVVRPAASANEKTSYRGPFAIMTALFFMWGFMTVWNDILIPRFKDAFELSFFHAMLVQFMFFGAYGIGAFAYFLISTLYGDPINKIGYKNGVIIGLLTAAFGSFMFYPAAHWASFNLFLAALFIVGIGFAMLQIAANPYITILGPEKTASSRLNLAGGFNSLGTTIGPVIGGWLIFNVFMRNGSTGIESVKLPYICFGACFLLLAILFKVAKLPAFKNEQTHSHGLGALKRPYTALGMLAIFMYVGGEVTVGSSVISFLGTPQLGGFSHSEASRFLCFYWGGLMIGRFMGAFALAEMKESAKMCLMLIPPVCAIVAISLLSGMAHALCYGAFLVALTGAFFYGKSSPGKMLAVFAGANIVLLALGMFTSAGLAMWSVLAVGLFCSVMWCNIFSLAIEGLGPLKSQASSLLIMAILGGAILPPLQGFVADHAGIQLSFAIPMISFAYILFYGLVGCNIGKKREDAVPAAAPVTGFAE